MTSCNVGKYLQPGEKVLRKNQVTVRMSDSSAVPPEVTEALSDVEKYYYQKPNKKILIFPLQMKLYCLPSPEDSSKLGKFLRANGEPPAIYDRNAAQRTAEQIATLLKTKGCFSSTVTPDTIHSRANYVIANYNITASPRYIIEEVNYSCRQKEIQKLLNDWKGESFLKKGDYYDQQKMIAEQGRLASNLKNEGYYYANNDLVRFIVDTNYEDAHLSILVYIRLPQIGNDTTRINLQKYYIDNIYIYPNVSTTQEGTARHFDTLIYPYKTRRGITNYKFVYDKKIEPSPKVISQSMFFFNHQTYRPRFITSTSNSLFGLHNFKYVDISFEESPNSVDTNNLLDVRVRLLNSNRHRLSLSFELTNASNFSNQSNNNFITSGNLGLGATLGYQNSNLFGGAEMLNVEGSLIFDLPKNVFNSQDRDFYSTFSSFEYGLNTSLDLPNFLLPFANKIQWQSNKPHTLIELNASYLFRNLAIPNLSTHEVTDLSLERLRFGSSFGYTWNHLRTTQHKLLPFNLSYSHIVSGKDYYYYLTELTGDPQFGYQAIDYVLLNTHYEFTFSNQIIGSRDNFSYTRFSVETAGNLLNGLNNLFSNDEARGDNGLLFYQYFRLEGEYKHYFYLNEHNTLVFRALAGFGIPYGNSTFMPYEKMFVGGGPTTMRGWALRHLGYGQYLSGESVMAMGTGDMQLVFNLEHRFPLISIFEGALFADAGNVWKSTDWGIGENNSFSPAKIYKAIAFDAGLGLRANVSIITLRLDFALPIYDPAYEIGNQWISDHWAWNKIVINFGINYPF